LLNVDVICLYFKNNRSVEMLRRFAPAATSQVCSSSLTILSIPLRGLSTVKIANRRRVEGFLASKYISPTRLATAAPQIAEEWNFDRNPSHIYPKLISVAALAKYWWKCSACGHSFEETTERRVLRGHGCPRCENRRAADSNIADLSDNALPASLGKKRAVKRRLRKRRRGTLTRKLAASKLNPTPILPTSLSSQKPLRSLLPGERSLAYSAKRAPLFSKRNRF
jgi:DNA-directed RNA polymerase subunit RPC12/RpoP